MNIAYQAASLIVYFVILVCWLIPKKLDLKGSFIFILMLVISGLTIITDAFTCYAIANNLFNTQTLKILMKVYLVLLVSLSYMEFAYLINKAVPDKLKFAFAKFSILAPVIDAVLIFIFDIEIAPLKNGIEVVGNAVYAAYGCACIYLFLLLLVLVLTRKSMNKWYRVCFITSAVVWSTAAILQYFLTSMGHMSVAFVCSLAAIFLFIENPTNYINLEYDCFKNNYLYTYINKLCRLGIKGVYILLNIEPINKTQSYDEKTDRLKKDIIKKCNHHKHLKVFINEMGMIGFVSRNYAKTDDYIEELNSYINEFTSIGENSNDYRFRIVSCSGVHLFKHADEIVLMVNRVMADLSMKADNYITKEITEKEILVEREEEEVKNEIIKALDEDRLEAFVQPIYSTEHKKIISAEALARIRKNDGSIMLPYQFIPVSEKTGLDIPLGYRMIEKICQLLSDPIKGRMFEYVDINLSISQCEQADMASKIIGIVQRYNLPSNRINLEITESGFVDKMAIINKNIRLLTGYGFGFSLDDFGSGESNLDYLVKMPVDYLKLDMHMIWAYFENERAKKTVKTIIKISHEMGLKVIAEGVETKEQLDELVAQKVDYVQGYYFYKPMAINDYYEIVKKQEQDN